DDAARVDIGDAVIGPVGDGRDLGAHAGGGTAAQFRNRGEHRFVTVTIQQLEQSRAANVERCRLRLDVSDALLGNADVRGDDTEDFRIEPALLEQLYWRQPQALLLDGRGRGREAAGYGAANVWPVAGVRQPAEDFSVSPDWHGKAHVDQVQAAEIGGVDEGAVALLPPDAAAVRDDRDEPAGRILHDADEDRQPACALGDQ